MRLRDALIGELMWQIMKKRSRLQPAWLWLAAGMLSGCVPGTRQERQTAMHYPKPPTMLQDAGQAAPPVLESAAMQQWLRRERRLTDTHLARLPQRQSFWHTLQRYAAAPQDELPVEAGGWLYWRHNPGGLPQAVLLRRRGLDGPVERLLDPNAIWPDGQTALTDFTPSPEGNLLAFAMAPAGADAQSLVVIHTAGKQDAARPWSERVADRLDGLRFTALTWTHDERGFFYSRMTQDSPGSALGAQSLYYHRLGTPQRQDRLIFRAPPWPDALVEAGMSDEGRHLWVTVRHGTATSNLLYVKDLGNPARPDLAAPMVQLATTGEAAWEPAGVAENRLVVRTDWQAPRGRVMVFDLGKPQALPQETIAETPGVIQDVVLSNQRIVVHRLHHVMSHLELFTLAGAPLGEVGLPAQGGISGVSGRAHSPMLLFQFSNSLMPPATYRYDWASGWSVVLLRNAMPPLDTLRFKTELVFYPAADGTMIPLQLTMPQGLRPDGSHPTILYGYGGFGISLLPSFAPWVAAWLEAGGVYAQANLRGGGEYGEAWHRAGMLQHKQVVFDDFYAAARYLIEQKITSPKHLAIHGRSNGGLLVGAALTQHPELFAAAAPAVGVLDMLHYHLYTGGRYWEPEYGAPDDPAMHAVLAAYSPLHHIVSGRCYPATLVMSAAHDDRVVPVHSLRFAASLQAAQGCAQPVLLRLEAAGSHRYRPMAAAMAEQADLLAFLAHHTGLEVRP